MLKLTKSKLILVFFTLSIIMPLHFSQVNGAIISESTIEASEYLVSPGTEVAITVHAVNDTNPTGLVGIDVDFSVPSGVFKSTGTTDVTVKTDTNGNITIIWIAHNVTFTENTKNATITATIQNLPQTHSMSIDIKVQHLDTNAITNSVFLDPGVVTFNQTRELSVLVRNTTNYPTEGMQVTVIQTAGNGTILDGTSDFEIDGITDTNGLFKFNWTSSLQPENESEVNVIFDIFIEAGSLANLTIFGNILVTPFDATELTVTLSGPAEVESGFDITIDILVVGGSFPANGANVTLTVGSGEFSNSDTQILLAVDALGEASFIYTAPIVETNDTVTINANAELLSLVGQNNLDILVYAVEKEFEAEMSFSSTQVKQNESLTITVTVIDKESTDVVVNATVSFLLELGVWVENDNALYSTTTNAQGIATATFDGTNTVMIFQIQKINVTATITNDNYAQLEVNGNFSLEKLPDTFGLTATLSSSEVTEGGTVTIAVGATINSVAYANTTVHFFAQGGTFNDGTSDYRVRTDAQGILLVTWDSSSMPDLQESRPIYIEVDLVNSGLDKILLSITVNPTGSQTTSDSDDGSSDEDGPLADPLVIGGVVGIIALVGVGVAVMRRGN